MNAERICGSEENRIKYEMNGIYEQNANACLTQYVRLNRRNERRTTKRTESEEVISNFQHEM